MIDTNKIMNICLIENVFTIFVNGRFIISLPKSELKNFLDRQIYLRRLKWTGNRENFKHYTVIESKDYSWQLANTLKYHI